MLDFARLEAATAQHMPFDHVVVTDLLDPADTRRLVSEFPARTVSGLLPASMLRLSPSLCELSEELRGRRMALCLSRFFGLEIGGLPTMLTVRCRCAAKDGRIHTDTGSKIVTLLFYLNPHWTEAGGRLRILRSGTDLTDYAAEVVPEAGTLVAFRRSENSWHGHERFEGTRRYLMVNWMRDAAIVRRETLRHRLAAGLKGIGL
jgi:SM-20-related protein